MNILPASTQGRRGAGDHHCTGFPAAVFISASVSPFGPPSRPEYAVAYTVHHGSANPLNSTQVLSSEGPALLSLPISPSAYNLAPGSPRPETGFSSTSSSSVASPEIGPIDSSRRSRLSFSSRSGFSTFQNTNDSASRSIFSPGSGGSLSDNPNQQRDLERKGLLNAAVRALASLKDVHGNRACIHLCTDSSWLVRIVNQEVPRWEVEGWPDVKKYDLDDVDEGLNLNGSDRKPPTPATDSAIALSKALKRREASEESNKNGGTFKRSAAERLADAVSAGNEQPSSPTSTAASSPRAGPLQLHDSFRKEGTFGSRSIQFDPASSRTKSAARRTSILSAAPSVYSLSSIKSGSSPEERDSSLLESLGSDFVLLRSLIQLIDSLSLKTNHTGGFKIYLIEGVRNPARDKSRERSKVEAEEREYRRKGQVSTLKKPTSTRASTTFGGDSKSLKSRNSIMSHSEGNALGSQFQPRRSASVKSKNRPTRSPLLGQEKASRSTIAEKAVAPRLRTYSVKSTTGSSGAAPIVHRNSSLAPPLPLSTAGLLIRSDSKRSETSSHTNQRKSTSQNRAQVQQADVPKDLEDTHPVRFGRPLAVQRSRSGESYQSAKSELSGRDQGDDDLETPSLENDHGNARGLGEVELEDDREEEFASPATPLEKEKIKFPKIGPSKIKRENGVGGGISKNVKFNQQSQRVVAQAPEDEMFNDDKKGKKGLFGGMFGNFRIMA